MSARGSHAMDVGAIRQDPLRGNSASCELRRIRLSACAAKAEFARHSRPRSLARQSPSYIQRAGSIKCPPPPASTHATEVRQAGDGDCSNVLRWDCVGETAPFGSGASTTSFRPSSPAPGGGVAPGRPEPSACLSVRRSVGGCGYHACSSCRQNNPHSHGRNSIRPLSLTSRS